MLIKEKKYITEIMSINSTPNSDEDSKANIILCNNFSTAKEKSAFIRYKPLILTNLQRGNTEATFCDSEGTLSFHERAAQGEITQEQIQQQTHIDFLDEYEFTPLHWACSYGQIKASTLLVNAGANVNTLGSDLISPLLLAASGGHHEIVKLLLLNGANVNHMDIIGNTALMYAAAGNHPHTCNEILGANPELMHTNEDNETAYSLAVENNANLSQAVIEKYIERLICLE